MIEKKHKGLRKQRQTNDKRGRESITTPLFPSFSIAKHVHNAHMCHHPIRPQHSLFPHSKIHSTYQLPLPFHLSAVFTFALSFFFFFLFLFVLLVLLVDFKSPIPSLKSLRRRLRFDPINEAIAASAAAFNKAMFPVDKGEPESSGSKRETSTGD